jgi:hypothetical protein
VNVIVFMVVAPECVIPCFQALGSLGYVQVVKITQEPGFTVWSLVSEKFPIDWSCKEVVPTFITDATSGIPCLLDWGEPQEPSFT